MKPKPGLMAFWNGTPFEFLHLVKANGVGAIWRVRPIFTETHDAPVQDITVRDGDRLRPIHTQSH